MLTIDDVIKEYKEKFGVEPVLGRGFAGDHIELLINAMDSDTQLIDEDYRDKDTALVSL
tara:strand:+ start:1493 stop:1669 length:177 start_codon:yes stop_codon:yes gene_type:complete